MKKSNYLSENIEIPERVVTLHQLSYYLLREFMAYYGHKYNNNGKYDIITDYAEDYSIGMVHACKVTARDIVRFYSVKLNSKNKQQIGFIIRRHLEAIIKD